MGTLNSYHLSPCAEPHFFSFSVQMTRRLAALLLLAAAVCNAEVSLAQAALEELKSLSLVGFRCLQNAAFHL